MNHTDPHDRRPAVAELLDDAFIVPVDVETAARHLWAIHNEANSLSTRRSDEAAPGDDQRQLVGAGAGGGRRSVSRAAAPLLVIVLMMSSSGMALAASQSSLPGDVLYPVKRGTEQAQLIFARSPEARTQLQLSFARARLEEIRLIATTRPQHVPALVAAINTTLTEVDRSAAEAAPDSQRIREEIAALQLQDIQAEVGAATPQEVTPAATPGPVQSTTDVATTLEHSETTSTATPMQSPTPEVTETAIPGQVPSEAASGDGHVITTTPTGQERPSPTPSPNPSPTPSTSPSPSPSPTPTPSDGPIVTAPPPVGEGGTSRSDDGSDVPADDPRTEDPSEQPSEPLQPYVRHVTDM